MTSATEHGGELRIANADGMSASFTSYGARLVELHVPDRDGTLENVVLGFDDVDDYRAHRDLYFGATIGRVAGRIAGGSFAVDGREYRLTRNEGANHLHGGAELAFDRVYWSAARVDTEHGSGLRFEYVSADGEEGYPGTLRASAEYSLSDRGELWMTLRAIADATTPVNMTNHAYWNLAGSGPASILDHELTIAAERIVAMSSELLPTGALEPVAGTVHDFRSARRIGERLPEDTSEPWPGFDAAFVLDEHDPVTDAVVSLHDPPSGRALDIFTSQPSIQMYTANRLPELTGRDGRPYRAGNAICLEPQRMPDAASHPEFGSIMLSPGEEYVHVTCHRFSAR